MTHIATNGIHQPVLRGQQAVAGLWFPAERFDEAERRQLLLTYWLPGSSAWCFEQGGLIRWSEPQRLQCEQLLGWPLVLINRTLCSAPLQKHEYGQLPTGDLWLVRNSQVETLDLKDATAIEPGQWLDINAYTLLDTYDCSAVLPEPVMPPLNASPDIREVLGNTVGAPPSERDEIMEAMRTGGAPAGKTSRPIVSTALKIILGLTVAVALFNLLPDAADSTAKIQDLAPAASTGHSAASNYLLIALVASGFFIGRWLMQSGLLQRSGQATSSHAPAAPSTAARHGSSDIPARRKKRRFTPSLVDKWLTRLTNASRLNLLFGKRQADYLQRMLDMFEEGNLNEALRHAIPLGSDAGERKQSFATPKPRADLKLRQQQESGASIGSSEDFQDLLRKTYRTSFEKLDREGRIDEAVFVLAELLKVHQEALDYLERHKRYRQSAELALAWDMPAATIVRHLCLTDDWQRAIQVARRDNAFEAAVTSMESKWPEHAQRLRLEWAEALADKGEWIKAVDVIWSLTHERPRAAQWLLNAEAGGEKLAAQALVKRAMLLPDTLQAYESFLTELRNDPARKTERLAIARALIANRKHTKTCAWLTTIFLGAIAADQQLESAGLQQLAKLSNDPLMQADLPRLSFKPLPSLPLREAPDIYHWQAPAPGVRDIADAVPLDDLRSLIALGESGVLILDAQGRTLCHFAVPAQRLILAESRQVALAVTRRGELWRVSKLDLLNRKVHDLGVLAMDDFARQFDGIGWTIGKGNHVRVVDTSPGFGTLWHIDNLPGTVVGVFANASSEHLLLSDPGGNLQCWRYQLPGRRLQARDELPLNLRKGSSLAFGLAGEPIEYWLNGPEAPEPVIMIEHSGRCAGYSLPGLDRNAIDCPCIYLGSEWMVVAYATSDGNQQLRFFRRTDDYTYACIDWPGREHIRVNCIAGQWTAFDAQGRLFCLNVEDARPRGLSIV
ncbi:hypothetical protein K5D56_01545 [Pseudomonas cichorii]|nr:bpX6 domain-containing protein [Pseudomonas cichorii]MBX8554257.1 hypothetical protein [Pseudomonas cichorii]MBX8559745.1 hypothetical protein [Pseudomonas cichorii]MBX8565523.1 hypothetical protein [Pseudomonas cichorii]MBX8588049.1 hypothetical protein [Pseudomonas cichorii]MBX8598280.1 hypothetical protein [Pseudomonas cichorii]